MDFDDIRPYRDEEIHTVMQRIADHPWILGGIEQLNTKRVPSLLRPVAGTVVKQLVRRKLLSIRTVEDFQRKIILKEIVDRVIRKTISELSCSGLENLDPGSAYVYISNHRDITLDPAFMNYFLYKFNYVVTEIAFGDNLLINDLVSDLIRANRAFIVKRNLPVREQIKASIDLSAYIVHTLQQNRSIWIAQREGRAKDGNDLTNPAVLKMMYLSQRKSGRSFSDFINQCRIVPVAISYEYDPCDRMKAWELYRTDKKGKHLKGKYEDLSSMYAGITGFKGRVHYSFGQPLSGNFNSEKEAAAAIDTQIHSSYRLWPSSYIGYDFFHKTNTYSHHYSGADMELMQKRLRRLPEEVRAIALRSYGRPLENREGVR